MSNTALEDRRRSLLAELAALQDQEAAGAGGPSFLAKVRGTPVEQWDDSMWDFANQRGLIPLEHQYTYEMRLLEARQAAERAQVGSWQGGNHPSTGTVNAGGRGLADMPPTPERPMGAALVREVGAEDEPPDDDDAVPYSEWDDADLEAELTERKLTAPAKNLGKEKRHNAMVATLEEDDRAQEQEPPQP